MVSELNDRLLPFQLERSGLRGRLVRLGPVVDTILARHDYPEQVAHLVGEFVVLGATLAGGLKFDGSFSLQARGDGPVPLLVADVTNAGDIRAYAETKDAAANAAARLDALLGKGYLAITVDQSAVGGETYQGIVELEGETLADCMLAYFRRSEQVPTGMRVAVERSEAGWRGGALVIQKLPDANPNSAEAQDAVEDWHRTMLLLSTLTAAELADPELSDEKLLYRLFHEEGVRVFSAQDLAVGCRCSKERIDRMLETFSAADLDEMVDGDSGAIGVTCHFCNKTFHVARDAIANR
ncbi:MAG: molecular chaperone Hsp33 [Geminicoccaceae bacterium]|nr:MAG: molecular chaperone Hsp33 [Geminicoccaceae bacterium]